jgi:hypothetical protein
MCIRSDNPKLQRRERTQENLKKQKRHTLKFDKDGDVVMDEWTNCVYCMTELSSSVL